MICSNSARPLQLRETLLTYGAHSLSDIELLAVFIGSGNRNRSCLNLAQDLIHQFGDLRALLNSDFETFQTVPGLGMSRYAQLQAVREMCRRSDYIDLKHLTQLTNTQQTYEFLKRQLRDKKNETFVSIFLDNQNRVIAYEELFTGTINTAFVHLRPIIERVLKLNAAAIILAHNHPSGHANASQGDLMVTRRIKKALELIDTQLLDHLIIGDNEVYSIIREEKNHCN
ncbi:RadC family protein [Legionella yabuuchiae]|uniref:RadC family protein n=1 Tax=Legionella yabuuchiae TaxID=376727 RepID=UPI0010562099|nr:DNA repair protein RadC [Legionella yabuuchiae]